MPGSEGEHRIGREVPGVDEQIGNRGGQAADQRRDCQRRVQAPEPRAGDVPDMDLLHAAVEHERRHEQATGLGPEERGVETPPGGDRSPVAELERPGGFLDPETAWSFELGNGAAIASWGRLDAALFWTEARRLLVPTFVLDGGVQQIHIRNISRARLRGLDASLAVSSLVRGLTSSIAYLLVDARDLTTDSVLSFRPRHVLTLGTDYQWRMLRSEEHTSEL